MPLPVVPPVVPPVVVDPDVDGVLPVVVDPEVDVVAVVAVDSPRLASTASSMLLSVVQSACSAAVTVCSVASSVLVDPVPLEPAVVPDVEPELVPVVRPDVDPVDMLDKAL